MEECVGEVEERFVAIRSDRHAGGDAVEEDAAVEGGGGEAARERVAGGLTVATYVYCSEGCDLRFFFACSEFLHTGFSL